MNTVRVTRCLRRRSATSWRRAWLFSIVIAVTACGPKPTVKAPDYAGVSQLGSPLGPSYILMPLPAEDDGLVGRILKSAPKPGQSIEEITAANPCEVDLEPAKVSETGASFEDAVELRAGASARAILGGFGFAGDASIASHFVYRIETTKRVSRRDKVSYAACCKEKGCGYGYVSALVFGKGEYASAEETRAGGRVDFAIVGTSGQVGLKTLHRRNVHGGLAVVVTITEGAKEPTNALGLPASSGLEETSLSDAVKDVYEANKVWVATSDAKGTSLGGFAFATRDGFITENEFVRRYKSLTGSPELDAFEHHRNPVGIGVFVGTIAVGVAGIGMTVYGLTGTREFLAYPGHIDNHKVKCDSDEGNALGNPGCTSKAREISGYVGMGMFVVGALGPVAAVGPADGFPSYDGSIRFHDLSDREARLYADRYNRILLRHTIQQVQKNQQSNLKAPGVKWTPAAGPHVIGLGIEGKF